MEPAQAGRELEECVKLCVEEVGELHEEECVEDCRELLEG